MLAEHKSLYEMTTMEKLGFQPLQRGTNNSQEILAMEVTKHAPIMCPALLCRGCCSLFSCRGCCGLFACRGRCKSIILKRVLSSIILQRALVAYSIEGTAAFSPIEGAVVYSQTEGTVVLSYRGRCSLFCRGQESHLYLATCTYGAALMYC